MGKFRFAILGAGNIAHKFCEAVSQLDDCEVAAVASKSPEKAKAFAAETGVGAYYGNYEEMLTAEKPDAAYIAVTPHDHFRLGMMCLAHGVPVLCEKAMFLTSADARALFAKAEEKGLFVMEAMWSRFLPSLRKIRSWLRDGAIGDTVFAEIAIAFKAPDDPKNRYFDPALGGGTAYDIVCYGWEILTWLMEKHPVMTQVVTARGGTGVDATSVITLKFAPEIPAVIKCSFLSGLEEQLVIYGSRGKIVAPHPHYTNEAFLYGEDGALIEHFKDEKTGNGFVYEIAETVRCVREGKTESPVVPHRDTVACSEVFDRILDSLRNDP